MILILCSLITAFVITFMAIPSIIRIAEIKHLFDVPDERKAHTTNVPTLGGLAIFAGLIFSLTFWASQKEIVELQYIIAAIMILFFMGMKDDLFNLVAYKKLIGQLLASFILVHWANIHITNLYGMFGVDSLSMVSAYALSMFTIVVITNSYNLIDGIDCLAGMIGIIAGISFGTWYYFVGMTQYVVLASSLVGSLMAFLYYNKTPARIFMGDTGSLIVGIVLSILAVKFIESNRLMPIDAAYKVRRVPVVAIGILIIPLFDTLRVFTIRVLNGRSPFSPDRNHLHHLLIDLGLTHIQAATVLAGFNIITIGCIILFKGVRAELALAVLIFVCLVASHLMARAANKHRRFKIVDLPIGDSKSA